jgi:hypothetical protein
MLRDRDVVVKAIDRYDHYEVADSVAALKRLVIWRNGKLWAIAVLCHGRSRRSGESSSMKSQLRRNATALVIRRTRLCGLCWQLRQLADEVLGDNQTAEADVMELVGFERHALA